MTAKRFTGIRLPDDMVKKMDARTDAVRGGFSESVRESLGRYLYILDYEREQLQDTFTSGELSLMVDLCNGTFWEPHTLALLSANIEDAEDLYFEKWQVDRKTLLTKLDKLTLTQSAVIVDAIEMYWNKIAKHERGEQPQPGEILK